MFLKRKLEDITDEEFNNIINDMINEMKVRYQMRPSDKITNIMDTASLVSKIWSATKE